MPNGTAALISCSHWDTAAHATRHTPRGPAYEERGYTESSEHYLSGGTNDHWFAPNLTGDTGSGLGRVPEQEIAAFLKSGHGGGLVTFGGNATAYNRQLSFAPSPAMKKTISVPCVDDGLAYVRDGLPGLLHYANDCLSS